MNAKRLTDLMLENNRLQAEIDEQCRLHAMGSEREARLLARVAELEKDAERWRIMDRPYIGGYEKGPNPSYLCRHRYKLADCIACLNEHLALRKQP